VRRRALLLALLAGCGSKPQQDPPTGSAVAPTPARPTDAWNNPAIVADAPPLPDAPQAPTRAQLGTVVAPVPAIALALDGKQLYALSAIDAVLSTIDLGTGAVTQLDKNPEKRGLPGGLLAGPDGLWWDEQKGEDCALVHAEPAKQVAPGTVGVLYGGFGPLAMDGKQLYVAGKRGLDRLDKKTANIVNVGTNKAGVTAFAADADNLYWLALNAAGDTSLMAAKKTGGDPVTLLKNPDIGAAARSLVLDGNTLYWSRGADIVAMPKSGGKIAVLVTSKAIGEIALVGASFYWVENDEAIGTAPKAGGAPKILGFADHAAGLVSDGKTLYWGTPFDVRRLAI